MTDKRVILEQIHQPTGITLFLASMGTDHIKHLIMLAQDPDLVQLMGWNPFFETHQIEPFLEAISCYALPYSRPSQPEVFGVYLDLEEDPIGYAVLKGLNRDLLTAEVGIAILARTLRTKGYGRLGLQRITDYAFTELGIQTVGAAIVSTNQGSINMCKKAGFNVREVMPKAWPMPDGELVDMVWMELTKHG